MLEENGNKCDIGQEGINGDKGHIPYLGTPSSSDEIYNLIKKFVKTNKEPEIPKIGLIKWLEKYNFKKVK